MNVRSARPEDARRIAEIQVETWRATYPGVMPQEVLDGLSVDDREGNWQEWIPSPETNTFVAELDGEIVGFVSVGPCWTSQGIGELYAIYVTPAGQGRGAGLALMEAGVGALSEHWDEAILWVATENRAPVASTSGTAGRSTASGSTTRSRGRRCPRRGTGCPAWARASLAE